MCYIKLINIIKTYYKKKILLKRNNMLKFKKNNMFFLSLFSAKICKERWKSLQDGYNRSLKRRKTKSGDGATTSKPWCYEKQMDFFFYNHFFKKDK